MTAPTLARHPLAAEVSRLRADLAAAHRELAQLRALIAAPDPAADIAYWRELFRDVHRGDVAAAYETGYRRGAEDADAHWMWALMPAREAAGIAARNPSHAELELRRWGPGGRARFGDPRPGDYTGGLATPSTGNSDDQAGDE